MTELLPAVQAAYQDLDKAPLDLRRQDRFSDLCIDMFLDGNPMSKMSHAAQAVLFAAWQDIDYAPIRNVHGSAAAVLRAASARVLHLCEDSVNSKFLEGIEASADLLDQIANELEPLEYPFCQRVRAALAQPEPEPPTDDELLRLACMTNLVYDNGYGAFPSCFIEDTDTTREALSFARAVLARWGTPATDLEQLNDH